MLRLLLRAFGVGLSAFAKTISDALPKPPPKADTRAALDYYSGFTASAKINGHCHRCGSRIRGADPAWVRPDEPGPSPSFYRYICDECRKAVFRQTEGVQP